jgi:hypothetical protein
MQSVLWILQEVFTMSDKSLKTFNLRRSTIKIVQTKQNQSQFVDRAINRLHNQMDDFLLRDVAADEILQHLLTRGGCPIHIKAVIRDYLEQTTTS